MSRLSFNKDQYRYRLVSGGEIRGDGRTGYWAKIFVPYWVQIYLREAIEAFGVKLVRNNMIL